MSATRPNPVRLLRLAALLAMSWSSLVAAVTPDIPAHQLDRHQWTVADGLPQTTVLDVTEDAQGYLWLATQDGLARFDGFDFAGFRLREHPALNHNYSNALAVDAGGTLWVGSSLGLARSAAGGFASLTPSAAPTGAVYSLLPARDGGVWVGAEHGLFRADAEGLHRVALPPQAIADAASQRVVALALGADGELAVALDDRLVLAPDGDARHYRLPGFSGLRSLAGGAAGSGVNLWVGGDDGVIGIDRDARMVSRPLRQHDAEALLLDRDGSLWIGTDAGLWRMRDDELPQRVQIDGLGQGSWIRSLHEARDGALWVGSHTAGVFRLQAGLFRRLTATDGLSDGIVWSIYADPSGELWAGGPDGVHVGGIDGFRRPFPADALPHPMVLAFLRDRQGTMWLGTREGLARLAPGAQSPTPVDGVGAMIYSLAEDRRGRLWIGSRSGVQRLADGKLETLGEAAGLPAVTARGILEASDGRVWIATDLGAWREGDDGRFVAVGSEAGLPTLQVHMIRETRPGEIMMALQGGIARSTLGGESVRIIDENDGLHAGMIMLLQPGPAETLWYNTHEGIGRLPFEQIDRLLAGSLDQLQPRVYGRLDDPQPAQCNGGHGNAGLLGDGRWLWCPSLHGALVLDLAAVDAAPSPPVPVLQQLRIGDSVYPLGRHDTLPAELPLGLRDLQIDFAGIHIGDPEAVRYQIQLHGYDAAPRAIGDRRSAFYTNLPPGDYRFELTAGLDGSGATQAPVAIAFRLPPTLAETRWFQALVLLGVVALALGLFRWRLLRVERQRRMLAQLVQQRTAELEDANRRLLETSVTDPLTGLRNRRYLVSEIQQDVAQVIRTYTTGKKDSNRDLLFLMIDLDHFKQVNDLHGHHAGDQVLVQFAQILDRLVRDCDYIIRWGGEEFLVIGRQADRAHSTVLAERIVKAVRAHRFETDHGELRCTCSVGIASYPPLPGRPGALGWEETIELADAATYVAKQEGRDRWVEFRLPDVEVDDDFMTRFRAGPVALADRGELQILRERAASTLRRLSTAVTSQKDTPLPS